MVLLLVVFAALEAAAAAHVGQGPANQGAEAAREHQRDDQRRLGVDEEEVDVDLLEVLGDQDQQQDTGRRQQIKPPPPRL